MLRVCLTKGLNTLFITSDHRGGVAQMVERALSMREVPGSIPGTSIFFVESLFVTYNM